MTENSVSADQQRLIDIFHPHAMQKIQEARKGNIRFAHYTTADAAMNIIKTKKFWMRKASCMNDYLEVKHGIDCLAEAYNGEAGTQLQEILNKICVGIADEVVSLFDSWIPNFVTNTYIACFSEHWAEDDTHGRLSMWRAYSESTGVALVLNNEPFLASDGPPGVYSSPVSYLDDVSFKHELQRVIEGIKDNEDFLRVQGQETVLGAVFNVFKFAVVCTKHRGFMEEREWRAIYMPLMEQSPHLEKSIEIVNGAPQPIYQFRLENMPNIGYTGIEIPEFLSKIIIGPTKYPAATFEAFATLLDGAGVKDPESRIHITDIPLRL